MRISAVRPRSTGTATPFATVDARQTAISPSCRAGDALQLSKSRKLVVGCLQGEEDRFHSKYESADRKVKEHLIL